MFAFMAVGFFLYRKKFVTSEGTRSMGNVLLYIVVPSIIIKSLNIPYSHDVMVKLMISFAAGIFSMVISIFIARIFFRKDTIAHFSTAFFNSGYLGLPLVEYVLGKDAVLYCAALVFLIGFLQWTYGVYVITQDKKSISFKKILFNPTLIGLTLGLIIFFVPFKLPELISEGVNVMAAMNAPLAMIILGAYLAQADFKHIFTDLQSYKVSMVRLLVSPLVTLLLLTLLPSSMNIVRMASLICVSTAVGANAPILAQLFDKDYVSASGYVSITTILAIATMPVVIFLAGILWKMG